MKRGQLVMKFLGLEIGTWSSIISSCITFVAVLVSLYLGLRSRRPKLIFATTYNENSENNSQPGWYLKIYYPEYNPVFLTGINITEREPTKSEYISNMTKRFDGIPYTKISSKKHFQTTSYKLRDLVSEKNFYLTIKDENDVAVVYYSGYKLLKKKKVYPQY